MQILEISVFDKMPILELLIEQRQFNQNVRASKFISILNTTVQIIYHKFLLYFTMNRWIIALLSLLLLYSCNKDEEDIYLTLSCEEISFGWNEETKNITIESNKQWHIDSELPSWLSITKTKNSNEGIIYITASENNTKDIRYCYIVLVASSQKKTIHVVQGAKENLLFIGEKTYIIDNSATELTVGIECNIDYLVTISKNGQEWITQVSGEHQNNDKDLLKTLNTQWFNFLSLEIAGNKEKEERHAEVIIYNESYNLSDTLHIIQKSGGDYLFDGEYIRLQQASRGNVNLVIMGDGFTKEDLKLNGPYETYMKQASEYFFSIEPYQSYRDYFNIYMVIAESEEEGVSEKGIGRKVKNKFGSTYGSGTEITCNSTLCLEYARKTTNLTPDIPITVIVVLNSTKYAGTTYLYANGNSIALCPMSSEASPNDFEGLVHHEAGGHGFGFLCDEYVYYKQQIPESLKQEIKEWQELGFQMNLDLTDNLSTILWKDFIGLEKYGQVDAYEGGYEYQYGIWRSEENSCMNNNIPYFNVQSRWSIVNRIMKLSGLSYSIQDFIRDDKPAYPSRVKSRTVSLSEFKPLASPILIKE